MIDLLRKLARERAATGGPRPPRSAGAVRWPHLAVLIAILGLGAGLRLWGLGWSLPDTLHQNSYHGGESRAVAVALQMDVREGDLEPRWRGKPYLRWGSHWFYTLHAANLVCEAAGWIELPERFDDPASIALGDDPARQTVAPDNASFARAHLIARTVSVLYSLATILLVWLFARGAYGARTARWAALGVALCPLLAYQARYATVNSSLTFWCALAVVLADRAARRATLAAFFAGALAIGLACAIKLAALPLVAVAGVALLLARPTPHPAGGSKLTFVALGALVTACGVLLGFGLGMPYAYVHGAEFWAQFSDELASNSQGHGLVFVATGNGFVHMFVENLAVALYWPLWAASLLGVAWTAREAWRGARARTPERTWPANSTLTADVLTLTWIAVNVFVLSTSSRRFLRYLMPMAPFLVLCAARCLAQLSGADRRPRVRRAATAAAGLVALATLAYAAASVRSFALEDPRDACARWFHEQVPAGTSIGFVKRPYNVTPPLYEEGAGPAGFPADVPRYRISILDADPARLAAQAPEWIVLNPLELHDETRLAERCAGQDLAAGLDELGLEPAMRDFVLRASAFRERFAREYELRHTWQNSARVLGLSFDWPAPPQGWGGPTQPVQAWRRKPDAR